MSAPDLAGLMEKAKAARIRAYAPYSRFTVGAALLCADGEIVTGCNVENASYGLAMCAERVALYAALACGKRGEELLALCVAGAPKGERAHARLTAPCGACRQVLHEFHPQMLIGCSAPEGVRRFSLEELLPKAFGPNDLA